MNPKRIADPNDVINAVVIVTRLPFEELISDLRAPAIVEARRLVALVCRRRTRASYLDLSEAMRRPRLSHSSVIERYQKAVQLEAENGGDNAFALKARAVERVLDELLTAKPPRRGMR